MLVCGCGCECVGDFVVVVSEGEEMEVSVDVKFIEGIGWCLVIRRESRNVCEC